MMRHHLLSLVALLAIFVSTQLPLVQLTMTGGWSPADPKEEGVQRVAEFAVMDNNKRSNSMNHDKLIEVVTASRQVVSGIKYRLQIKIGQTNCRKNHGSEFTSEHLAACEVPENNPRKTCDVEIWEQKWKSFVQVLKYDCRVDGANSSPGDSGSVPSGAPDVIQLDSMRQSKNNWN